MPRYGASEPEPKIFTAILVGLLIGTLSMLAAKGVASYLTMSKTAKVRLAPEKLSRLRPLLEAESPSLRYRAFSSGIQAGTPLYNAIMAAQPELLDHYEEIASKQTDVQWRADVHFRRVSEVGPITSLLRVEYLYRNAGLHELKYASSMLNRLRDGTFELSDLFLDNTASRLRLNARLCEAVSAEKKSRIGAVTFRGKAIDCEASPDFDFIEGPPFALKANEQSTRFEGIYFYYEPGRIGARQEGEYIVFIPIGDIADMIHPNYRSLFPKNPD
ncbi:hypothetical protein [Ponticaulis profundi]|uniref:DUF3298 domain-containing protein n=1 Tax=Ponticaulis profundi TaxID=2665222 RepID=A0ABW1S5J5_9PROT